MADLFSVTAPLRVRYPDGSAHVMIHSFPHALGLVYFRPFWERLPPGEGIVLLRGEVRGSGPWKVGAAVVTLLGCHGTHPESAAQYAAWQAHLTARGGAYPQREELAALARAVQG